MGELINSLGLDWAPFLWQLIAFLILLGVLWRFAFRPVTRILDERANRIRNSIETAERVQREMSQMEERSRQLLEESRRESQHIVTQAQQAADRIQAQAEERARQRQDEIVTRAQAEIDRSRLEAMEGLRREVADLAITAASRVVRRELDPSTHYQLINEVLAEGADGRTAGERPVA